MGRGVDVAVQVKKLIVRAREEQGKTWEKISEDFGIPIRTARNIGGFLGYFLFPLSFNLFTKFNSKVRIKY